MERARVTAEARGEEKQGHALYTVLFPAGTALLMVCLKISLVERWRAWAFFALNLVLLLIVFTSARPDSSSDSGSEENRGLGAEKDKEIGETVAVTVTEPKQRKWTGEAEEEEWHDCCEGLEESVRGRDEGEDEVEDRVGQPQLTKKELNERVEAFIAMFRQHLVLDAKNGCCSSTTQLFVSTTPSYNNVVKC